MADIKTSKLGQPHGSLPSENFTAKIFSPSRLVFPGFQCKANSYYTLLKSTK